MFITSDDVWVLFIFSFPCLQHLVEKSWYMVLETFILLAGFHEDMQVGFVATITFLFVVKAFHWLIEERINYVSWRINLCVCVVVELAKSGLQSHSLLPSLPFSDGTQSTHHLDLPLTCHHIPRPTSCCGPFLHVALIEQSQNQWSICIDSVRFRGTDM